MGKCMKKKILVVILLTFLLILSGCNVTDQASKDEASSEEKKVEKIEKLLEDFEDATTYDKSLNSLNVWLIDMMM